MGNQGAGANEAGLSELFNSNLADQQAGVTRTPHAEAYTGWATQAWRSNVGVSHGIFGVALDQELYRRPIGARKSRHSGHSEAV